MRGSSPMKIFILLVLIIGASGLLAYAQRESADPWQRKARLETPLRMRDLQKVPNLVPGWPPEAGKAFPPVRLTDAKGAEFSVELWRGKPTLIEIVAMSCAGCQAFSGGGAKGGYGGFPSQGGLDSIEFYFKQYTGHDLFSDKINYAQILIYNLKLEPATADDLSAWAKHFGFNEQRNTVLLTGGEQLANQVSFRMIPGFLLLDRDLTVLFDSTGHTPRHNLWQVLLPAAKALLDGERPDAN